MRKLKDFFKDPIRMPFEEKYSTLPERWNVNQTLVTYYLRYYSKRLEEELRRLNQLDKIDLPEYFADRRTDPEYIYDLIEGWLLEDLVVFAWLESRLKEVNPGISIEHFGTDRNRKVQFKDPSKISSKADFVCELPDGRRTKIELQVSREYRESYDVKENKIKRALREGGVLFLWVILPMDKYFFLLPSIFESKPAVENPYWDGKLVRTVSISEVEERGWGPYLMREPLSDTFLRAVGVVKNDE